MWIPRNSRFLACRLELFDPGSFERRDDIGLDLARADRRKDDAHPRMGDLALQRLEQALARPPSLVEGWWPK